MFEISTTNVKIEFTNKFLSIYPHMEYPMIKAEYLFKETLNGVKIKKKHFHSQLTVLDSILTVEIFVLNSSNKILETKLFKGPITSTVADIKASIKTDMMLLLKMDNRFSMLSDNDCPLFKIFELRKGVLKCSNCALLIARPIMIELERTNNFKFELGNLRKLIAHNISISKINLESLPFLKYLRLINAGLRYISSGHKVLEYCNLSNNYLVQCKVRSKVLILRSNLIHDFKSDFNFKFLNLSYNPLETFDAHANCLVIKKTCNMKTVIACNSKIIIADGSKHIKIGSCPNLKYLSVNRCGLTKLSFSVKNIIVFKASNNYLQRVPKFKNSEYVNLSGNFLEFFNASSVKAIDIAMNHLRSFNFSSCSSLRYLDISFNPIDQVHSKCPCPNLKTIFINNSQAKYFTSKTVKTILNHQCKKCTTKNISQYKMEINFQSIPTTIFVLFNTSLDEDFTGLIDYSFKMFKDSDTQIDLYSDFSNYIYSRVTLLDPLSTVLFTFVTSREVIVKTFHFPVIVYNFAEIKRISKPKYLFSFHNSSAWIVAPLICPVKNFLKKKGFVLNHESVDVFEILQFMKCFCPKPFYFKIVSSPDYFDLELPSDASRIFLIKKTSAGLKIPQETNFFALNDFLNRCTNLGLSNHDFNKNIRRSDVIAAISHTETPVFAFMKFIFISDRIKLIETEKNNIFGIVDFYCKIFGGNVAEKNYGTYIIKFNGLYHAVLFSLKIEHILHAIGIEISIGISSGLIFSSYSSGIMYFGGPVLNKTARMAHIGTGVFCCSCVKLQTDVLYEIFDEGERFLKGFDESHRIFSVKLSNRY